MIAIRLPTARYLATGGFCTGVHYSLMYVLIRQGVGTTVASGVGAGMALMLSYVLNDRWVFPNQIGARTSLLKFVMVALAALLMNTAQLSLGIALGLHDWLAQIISTGVLTMVNFTLHRFWTFDAGTARDPHRRPAADRPQG